MSFEVESLPKTHEVEFSRSAPVGAVEKLLSESFANNAESELLELNFAKCEFIEVATLVFILALIRDRTRKGLKTIIKLPEHKRTRDFLRLWDFPAAVASVSGRPFREIACRKEDELYFGENKAPTENSYQNAHKLRDDAIRQLYRNRFFALQSFIIKYGNPPPSLVLEESSRWNGQLVKSVLAKQLRGPEGYLSSRIVFEAITNALRHSSATMIVSGSMFDEPGETRKDGSLGFFTIVYWDDGESMVNTLKSAINAGKSVRLPDVRVDPDKFNVIQERPSEELIEQSVFSDLDPKIDTPDWLLLLATTFPGITRDVAAKGYASQELKQEHPEYDAPGMGLYVLLNTVIDIFKGTLTFRTREFFMSLKMEEDQNKGKYKARIKTYPPSNPPFRGNMLTIRLPLKRS